MKHIGIILFPIFSLIFVSCNQSDPMPNFAIYDISKIYSINLDGSGLKLITNGTDFSLLPNGKMIYMKNNKLYSCNPDGSDILIISPANIDIYSYQIYQQTKILFITVGYPNDYVYIMNIDGRGLTKLRLFSQSSG